MQRHRGRLENHGDIADRAGTLYQGPSAALQRGELRLVTHIGPGEQKPIQPCSTVDRYRYRRAGDGHNRFDCSVESVGDRGE
jgi:hypothetical protein